MTADESQSEGQQPHQLPRFQRAALHAHQLGVLIAVLGGSAVLLLLAALIMPRFSLDPIWQPIVLNDSAALLVVLIGLYCALQISRWRREALAAVSTIELATSTASHSGSGWRAQAARIAGLLKPLVSRGSRLLRREELFMAAVALIALWAVRHGWNPAVPGASLQRAGYVGAGLALACAYGLLVLERYLSGPLATEWPEAPALAYLIRAAILACVLGALCLIFDAPSRLWPARLAVCSGLIPAALALELLLRALLSSITRAPAAAEPAFLAQTFLARLFTWPPRPWAFVHEELHQRYGIDLRQNWAFRFVRRSSLPLIAAVAFIGWLSTGLHELPVARRGIYERFGRPVQVWDPGMHWGLPWPLARMVQVDNGVVYELAASISTEPQAQADNSGADDPAPASADRLWDVAHTSENAQVISSEADAKQNFQVVNMDVRFVYRIGLTHEAAMAVTYRCADVETLIRSTASRVMVHYFASRTLAGLLGAQRDLLARDLQREVQAQMDRFGSGVELLSVLIESIHPPAGAAAAYHSVQAAVITAQAIVAQERGTAAITVNEAHQSATAQVDEATAVARENTVGAEVAQTGSNAELESFRAAGPAFVRERYFNQLAAGLAKANLIVVDHRIGIANNAPTIDLRTFSNSGAASP
jgi:regulator of protease activity HflC (stomatin/prohibitin superfamily)